MKIIVMMFLLVTFTVDFGWGKTVGVWKVHPMYVNDTMVKTLTEAGWNVVSVGNTNLTDGAVLNQLDVLLAPGGWDLYPLAGFKARRNIVRFVAGGKGLLDTDVNTLKRPLFPQVGVNAWYVQNARITASGTNVFSAILGDRYMLTNNYCYQITVGPTGKVFAASGEAAVGVYGEVYGGRYAVFGYSLLGDTNNMERFIAPVLKTEEDETVLDNNSKTNVVKRLPAFLNWLASAPTLAAAEKVRQQAQADLDFLRQERLGDWTLNCGGAGFDDLWLGHLSVVPEMRIRLLLPLKKRLFMLDDLWRTLPNRGAQGARYSAMTNAVRMAVAEVNERSLGVMSNVTERTRRMEASELAKENPYLDGASVLQRLEAMPGQSETGKAAMVALVQCCVTGNPPPDASMRLAIYLHGQEVSEQIFPQGRWKTLLEGCDKVIAEFRAAQPVPKMAATVEERLRTDPLMMPYYTGKILPTPQKVVYKDEFVPMGNVAIVVGKDVENPDPQVEVLVERITRYGGKAAVVVAPGAEHTAVVSLGNTELIREVKGIPAVPDKSEGYVIDTAQVAGKPVFILKGHDRLGVLWSIASLMQLIHWRDGKTMARAATVEDYPILQKRGLILSGNDFFHPSRNRAGQITGYPDTRLMLEKNKLFMLTAKINEPCYQNFLMVDCYWRDWKHPEKLPAESHVEEDIEALGKSLSPLGITWWAGMRPGDSGDYTSNPEELSHKLCADDESVEGLLYFARKAEEAGGHLSVLLDDVRFPITQFDKERLGTGREVDTWVLTRVMAQLKKEFPKPRLLVCPPFYWGPLGYGWVIYGEDREEYLRMVGDKWQPEIEVFWSGQQVNGGTLASKDFYKWWMGLAKRKPYFWQNCTAYWCHIYRRHYPTDPLNTLWMSYWEGQFDVLGWYGFNGADISRYAVTDGISGDFQWNPVAYGKDKETSALRSVREVAEKFIGEGSWPYLTAVTEPLAYFDGFETDDPKDLKGQERLRQQAAKNYEVVVGKRDAVYSGYKTLLERYPVSVPAWTSLGSFIGVASGADSIMSDPALRLFRGTATQRLQLQKKGEFLPEKDVFLSAADFEGGLFEEVSVDDVAKRELQPALVLGGPKRQARVPFLLTKVQAAGSHEFWVKGRQNATAGRLTMSLNGKPVFNDKAPFGKMEASMVHFAVPGGLLTETNNVLEINLAVEEVMPSVGDDLDGVGAGNGPPLAINYVVLKSLPGK